MEGQAQGKARMVAGEDEEGTGGEEEIGGRNNRVRCGVGSPDPTQNNVRVKPPFRAKNVISRIQKR